MKKWQKVLLWIGGCIVGLILILWLVLQLYFKAHKQEFLEKATQIISERVHGEATVGGIHLRFLTTFPDLAITLQEIEVRDSLYPVHLNALVKLEELRIFVNILPLLSRTIAVDMVSLENGRIFLYENEKGYSSTDAFKRKLTGQQPKSKTRINKIKFHNVNLVLVDPVKTKTFDVLLKNTSFNINNWIIDHTIKVDANLMVNKFAFREAKGSFAEGSTIQGKFNISFDKDTDVLSFKKIRLLVDRIPLDFTGKFNLKSTKEYSLQIVSNETPFLKAARLLPKSLSEKIDSFDIDAEFYAEANVDGFLIPYINPKVKVSWDIKNANVRTVAGILQNASFKGFITDRLVDSIPSLPENSLLQFENISAVIDGINFTSNKISIENLVAPVLKADLKAKSDAKSLNLMLPLESIDFQGGLFEADLTFDGPIYASATQAPAMNGKATFKNVSFEYIPRGLKVNELNGDLTFKQQDIICENINLKVDSSLVNLHVVGKNLLSIVNDDPSLVILDASIHSPRFAVESFTKFIGKTKTRQRKNNQNSRITSVSKMIDGLLNHASIRSTLKADVITYKKFKATTFTANIALSKNEWDIKNTRLNFADGSVQLDAFIKNGSADNNPIRLKADLVDLDVSKTFKAFNSFGLTSLKPENINGKLTTAIDISGIMHENAALRAETLNGTIDLSLKKGALINWEPLQKMAIFIFKNRDFNHVTFDEISNTIQVNGKHMTIDKMEIQSSVLTLFAKGLYDMDDKHTNLSIQIPLTNLKKRDPGYVPQNTGKTKNLGVSVFVNARNDTNGDIHYSWGFFDKNAKNEPGVLTDPVKPRGRRKNIVTE